MSNCRYCLTSIKWITSPLGDSLAVSAEPVKYELLDSRANAWIVTRSGVVRSAHDLPESPPMAYLEHRCANYREAIATKSPPVGEKLFNPVPLIGELEAVNKEKEARDLIEQLRKSTRERERISTYEREFLDVE